MPFKADANVLWYHAALYVPQSLALCQDSSSPHACTIGQLTFIVFWIAIESDTFLLPCTGLQQGRTQALSGTSRPVGSAYSSLG